MVLEAADRVVNDETLPREDGCIHRLAVRWRIAAITAS